MDVYDDIVYLDVPKTASTFISRWLKQNLQYKERIFAKHGRIGDQNDPIARREYDPKAFYFISVRHPLGSYYSLFNYGLDGNGHIYNKLCRKGMKNLYDRELFNDWLYFMLDPKNARLLGEGYRRIDCENMGFMTFRFLSLSFCNPIEFMKSKQYSELIEEYENRKIHSFVIRQEHLIDDMEGLIKLKLHKHINVDTDRAVLNLRALSSKKVNASSGKAGRTAPRMSDLPDDLRDLLLRKERFLISQFYS